MYANLDFKQQNGSNRGGEDAVVLLSLQATADEARNATADEVVDLLFATNRPHQLNDCETREEYDGETNEYTQEDLEQTADDCGGVFCNGEVFVSPQTTHYENRVVLDRSSLKAKVATVLKPENWLSSLAKPDVFKLNVELTREGNAD